MNNELWWRGAVVYQVYPRSLMDSNGDGVGDLRGIIHKLDYIDSLGVDAIWISPFFKSPMKDFGYDISDYRNVDPLFGTLEDFDDLVAQAHARNIKIIIDQVLSHTSDQHAWFKESRSNCTNDKQDWYVWADPKADGTPPNNWLSIFGGSAWQWDSRRGQYYLHNFLDSQPDLNFHNPQVRAQILDEVHFWLKRGVDGFRLDAINFCFHDQLLRDNPSKPIEDRKGLGFTDDNPYAYQSHVYDKTQPENIAFLGEIRALLDRYPGSVSLGEIGAENSLETMAEYTHGHGRLHMAYSFELLVDNFSADYIRETVSTLEAGIGDGWPCWSIGNHDVVRVMSRWGGENQAPAKAKLLSALLFSLRGSVCSYQGEELGLPEANLQFHQLQDPYGITFWPSFKGRDGCRTPMPWTEDSDVAGFTAGKPWLPVPREHRALAVNIQDENENSVLNAYRTFLHWRADQPALRYGDIEFFDSAREVLSFQRTYEGQVVSVFFNLSAESCDVPVDGALVALEGHGFSGAEVNDGRLLLPAFGAFFGSVI